MLVLRSALFNAAFFLFTGLCCLSFTLILWLPRRIMVAAQRWWAARVLDLLRLICGIEWQVRGRHHLPPNPVIIAAKHQSAWDTLVWQSIVGDPAIVMKAELMRIPFYGWICQRTKQIAIDRRAGAKALKDMIRAAREARDASRGIVIFPQGTRVAPGAKAPYQPGIAALYRDLGLPVVPVALNSGLFWGRRSFLRPKGTIVLELLEPIPPGLDRRTFMARLEQGIETATTALCEHP